MSVKPVIADDMNFFTDSIKLSGISQRVESFDNCQQASISNGQVGHIFVSDSDLIDFRNSSLRFTVTTTQTSNNDGALPDSGVGALISKVRISIGSELITEIVDFDLLFAFWTLSQGTQCYNTILTQMYGASWTLSQRQSAYNAPTNVYMVPIGKVCDFLNKVIPVSKFNGQQIHLEIFFNSWQNCCSGTGSIGSFSIQNLQFHYDQITVTGEYNKLLNDKLASGVIQIPFLNYINYTNTIQPSVNRQSSTLPWKYSRFISFFNINRIQANLTDPTNTQKFTNYQLYSQFIQAKFRANNK